MNGVRILLCFLAITFSLFAVAQPEASNNKTSVSQLQRLYNNGKYDSIFQAFSPEMQKALPLEKTVGFFSGVKSVSGKMVSAQFEKYESSYAAYKAVFERRTYSLFLASSKPNRIEGLLLQPYSPANLPKLNRNITSLILPFSGAWTVFWGGDTKELNYHVERPVQKGAFDFIITDSTGREFKTDSKTNEDYYAFGKDLIAVCDAKVVMVVDGIHDNIPGTMNPMFATGNTVVLKTANNEFIVYAHFKKHSIAVKEGQIIKQGQLLGKCGNSGNSNQPHLHFHIQNVEDMNIALGAKAYFTKIKVNDVLKSDNSPIKKEVVQNP